MLASVATPAAPKNTRDELRADILKAAALFIVSENASPTNAEAAATRNAPRKILAQC